MNGRVTISNPEQVQLTVMLTAPVSEWKRLREQLSYEWPSSDLRYAILSAVAKATDYVENIDPAKE